MATHFGLGDQVRMCDHRECKMPLAGLVYKLGQNVLEEEALELLPSPRGALAPLVQSFLQVRVIDVFAVHPRLDAVENLGKLFLIVGNPLWEKRLEDLQALHVCVGQGLVGTEPPPVLFLEEGDDEDLLRSGELVAVVDQPGGLDSPRELRGDYGVDIARLALQVGPGLLALGHAEAGEHGVRDPVPAHVHQPWTHVAEEVVASLAVARHQQAHGKRRVARAEVPREGPGDASGEQGGGGARGGTADHGAEDTETS
mmetsp:Transcript_26866/g.81018  ORF Transcript_26866/g.81018 Transcript_26866/m.81018 type:complete len:256 (+) Transcript_26866:380-1147(+)